MKKILLIKDVANLNNGKYLYFWRKNPDKLLMFVNHTHYLPKQLENLMLQHGMLFLNLLFRFSIATAILIL